MMMSDLNKKKIDKFRDRDDGERKRNDDKKKISVENDDFHMFETFDMKNSTERTSTKFVIDDITLFLNISKILSFDFEKFLR